MKRLFVCFGFLMIPVFFGCQESPVFDPATDESNLILNKKETINLYCPVMDPISGQCAVRGKVTYDHEVVGTTHYNLTNVRVNLGIKIDAEIMSEAYQVGFPRWTVLANSQQSFFLKNMESSGTLNKGENERSFVKHYNIDNRDDLLLEVNYVVNLNSLRVNRICLAPAKFNSE